MITTPTPTPKRRYPRKPEKQVPVFVQKSVDAAQGIELLNQFVSEVRKEFRKRDKLTVKGDMVKTDCQKLTFANAEMSITIDFTGGMAL